MGAQKNRPCLTERLLMGRKEPNQTNKILHENRLLADDSHEISYLIFVTLFFSKIQKNVAKFVVWCSRDWRFKGQDLQMNIKEIIED